MSNKTEPDYTYLSDIDRLIHEPARLAIMAVLSGCESADFQFLLRTTGLNKGNLSAQAIKLSEAGYVDVEKGFRGRTPYTLYRLTPLGKGALEYYQSLIKNTLRRLGKPGK
ncbi:MAG: transcriptional regulator [Anaerolineae bacterium]|nr:transcriptional regulator [Anaerolineae bacterium]